MKIIYNILIFIVLSFISLGLNAQDNEEELKPRKSKKTLLGARAGRRITGDLRFGLNMSEMDIQGGNSFKTIYMGYFIGGLVNMKFYKDIQFQTGLLVTRKGLKKEQYSQEKRPDLGVGVEALTDRRETVDASYIQIPLNIGFEHYFTTDFAVNINGGLYIAHGFKGESRVKGSVVLADNHDTVLENLETGNHRTFNVGKLKRFDYGLGISAGIVYDIYVVSLGYDHGLANISDKQYTEIKNRNTYLSLGFRF